MASTLGVETEDPRDGHEHEGPHDHDSSVAREAAHGSEGELHPWAKEMYRNGLSFNGNERSKLFLGRGDATFEDLSDLCGADSPLDGRGLLSADFDDDGDLDLFVHNLQRERHSLLRNELVRGRSLKVRLEATRSQYEAIGATVTVEGPLGVTSQVLSRGAGYASCQAPELVFGLGDAEGAEVRVHWPWGAQESFGRVTGPGTVLLVEGTGRARTLEVEPFQLCDPLPQGLKIDIGETLPPVALEAADGGRVEIDWTELAAGRTVYLNLWASYCGPCVAEIPELERIHQARDRTVVALSVDVPDNRGIARELLAGRGGTYPLYFIGMDADEDGEGIDEVVDLLRLPVPTTLVLDPNGRLVDVVRGALGADLQAAAGD